MTIEKIQKYLVDNQISVADVSEYDDGTIEVGIEWGDWKHDHALCDVLMKEIGYELDGEYETEEDGSDCYSSIHQYKLVENNC